MTISNKLNYHVLVPVWLTCERTLGIPTVNVVSLNELRSMFSNSTLSYTIIPLPLYELGSSNIHRTSLTSIPFLRLVSALLKMLFSTYIPVVTSLRPLPTFQIVCESGTIHLHSRLPMYYNHLYHESINPISPSLVHQKQK